MIAGPPGSYKSTFALNMVTRWADEGVTAFYVSADSDQLTVAKRCAAIMSGDPTDIVERTIRKGAYSKTLNRLSGVQWYFRAVDMNELGEELQAFEVSYGHTPELVVIDNLMNCVDNPADFAGQLTMTRDLDTLARDIKAHIMILHHSSEGYQGTGPPPRSTIQGKVSQFPRLVLTLNCVNERLAVAVVKNTNGPQQADGGLYTDFIVDTSNGRIVAMP
jgi:RecA-family ATPase